MKCPHNKLSSVKSSFCEMFLSRRYTINQLSFCEMSQHRNFFSLFKNLALNVVRCSDINRKRKCGKPNSNRSSKCLKSKETLFLKSSNNSRAFNGSSMVLRPEK